MALCFPKVSLTRSPSSLSQVLKWLRAQKPPAPWGVETCSAAAHGGHLDVLKWLRSQKPRCPWDEETCAMAARRGHLEVSVSIFLSRSFSLFTGLADTHTHTLSLISQVLQWLRAQKPRCPWSTETTAQAAAGAHLEVLRWLRAQNPPCPWDDETTTSAAAGGSVDVLEWLRAQDPPCPWEKNGAAVLTACIVGHLEVLKWLRAQAFPSSWATTLYSWIEAAAKEGHLEVSARVFLSLSCTRVSVSLTHLPPSSLSLPLR